MSDDCRCTDMIEFSPFTIMTQFNSRVISLTLPFTLIEQCYLITVDKIVHDKCRFV